MTLSELYTAAMAFDEDKLSTTLLWSEREHFMDGAELEAARRAQVDECVARLIEAAERYRNHGFCECGCENCDNCADDCVTRSAYDNALAELRKSLEGCK